MEIGVFDHLDRGDVPLPQFYEDRLRVVAAYEAAGFARYHVAEHHSTPLGLAPSPGIYLSSVAQRTRRIRFGPLVYLLPLYHPLRLAEEIAMLDALSGGRYEVGVGRGISPIESMLYGRDPAEAQSVFDEVLAIVELYLRSETLTFAGKHFRFENVPVEIRPVQRPHPPLWYGVSSPRGAARAAEQRASAVTLATGPGAREIVQAFLAAADGAAREALKIGICRFVVVAATDEAARAIGRRAFPLWHERFHHLYHAYGREPVHGARPDFDGMLQHGGAFAGAPATVAAAVDEQLRTTGANYFVGQFHFGDMTVAEATTSVRLFAEQVLPALQKGAVR